LIVVAAGVQLVRDRGGGIGNHRDGQVAAVVAGLFHGQRRGGRDGDAEVAPVVGAVAGEGSCVGAAAGEDDVAGADVAGHVPGALGVRRAAGGGVAGAVVLHLVEAD